MTQRPRVRPIKTNWIEHQGEPVLTIQDPLGIAQPMAVSRLGALLLSMCDGERDVDAITASLSLRLATALNESDVRLMLEQLDQAYLLEGPHLSQAHDEALRGYRAAACRPMLLAGPTYARQPRDLVRQLRTYGLGAPSAAPALEAARGLISPHIDYQRGGPRYAEVWNAAAQAAGAATRAIVLGTGHYNRARFTLTRQSYATPLGLLPTDLTVVDALAEVLGREEVFAEELTHVGEHSIELAAVWLHGARGGAPLPLVPVLCGSFRDITHQGHQAQTDAAITSALQVLEPLAREEGTLVIAAADLAHVGPAFGDPPFAGQQLADLETADRRLLEHVTRGDAEAFLDDLVREEDARKVCGLPPIYLTLRLLGASSGAITGYEQCPADGAGTSWVSVAGVVL